MNSKIYIEGGGDSKELRARCREGFRKLLERCGFHGRMPRLIACGGRNAAYDDFRTAHSCAAPGDYIAILVDSENVVADGDKPWEHLKSVDGWERLVDAADQQSLLMIRCMETWIVCDHSALKRYFGASLRESVLPTLNNIETQSPKAIFDALVAATKNCKNKFAKGRVAFEALAQIDPAELSHHSPSFARFKRPCRITRKKPQAIVPAKTRQPQQVVVIRQGRFKRVLDEALNR